jgi:hypothetical protein
VKADSIKPAGEHDIDYQEIIRRKLEVPKTSLFNQRELKEGIHDFEDMAAMKRKELLAIHPEFDSENDDQDDHLDAIWQHLMSHYFEVMSPWVKEIYHELNESDQRFLDKEIADTGVPVEIIDEGALHCLRTSFLLMKSDALERCGADDACIVFEALKAVELSGKKMLEKPFSERKEEIKEKAREISDSRECKSKLGWHVRSLKLLDKRYISFDQIATTVDNVSMYCDCNRAIHGTRHIGIILVVFGRKYTLTWNDPIQIEKKITYIENPLKVSYVDERSFIELCNNMCVAQTARNRYVHSSLGSATKPQNQGTRQAEISEVAKLTVEMLRGLHGLAFA